MRPKEFGLKNGDMSLRFWGFNHRWKNTFSVASLLRKEKKKNENRESESEEDVNGRSQQ